MTYHVYHVDHCGWRCLTLLFLLDDIEVLLRVPLILRFLSLVNLLFLSGAGFLRFQTAMLILVG